MEVDAKTENPPPHGDGDPNENSAPASSDVPKPGHDEGEPDMGLDDGYKLVRIGRRSRKGKK